MKKLIRNGMWMLLVLVMVGACNDEDLLPDFDYEEDVAEEFENLTVSQFAEINAPFDNLFGSSPQDRVTGYDQDEVKALIEEHIQGANVLEVDSEEVRGLEVWTFEIAFESGAFLEISLVPELSKVIEVEGNRGPFDYDIDFGEEFTTLQDVLVKAKEAVKNGDVIEWELELEEGNLWEFEVIIETKAGLWEVEIVAQDGTVLVIKEEDEELDDDEELETAPEGILNTVSSMIDGDIIHSELEDKDEKLLWEVVVLGEKEEEIWFLFDDEENLLVVEGEGSGYRFEPGSDLKTLSEMESILTGELGEGEIEEWSLRKVSDDEWKYEFEIETSNGEFYALINGVTGEIFFIEGENDDDLEVDLSEEMIAFVNAIVTGDIKESYRDEYEGTSIIVVQLNLPDEVYVKVGFTETLELVWVYGSEEPIGTIVNPGDGFIELSEAVDIAHSQFDGEVEEWKFKTAEKQYRIELESEDQEVIVWIDATSGIIIESKS